MTDRDSPESAGIRRIELSGHDPIVLDGRPMLRIVESGSIAIFYAEVREGAPVGPRHLLHRAGAGQAIVSVRHDLPEGLRLLMVPIKRAELREVAFEGAWARLYSSGRPLASHVDEWIELLSSMLVSAERPKLMQRASESRALLLGEGESFRPERGTVLWARVEEGAAGWMGNGGPQIEPGSGCIPLGPDAWLRATGPTRLQLTSTAELTDSAALCDGLAWMHARLLEQLRERDREAADREMGRLRDRERIEARGAKRAFDVLVSVLDSRAPQRHSDDALVGAMTAVGAQIGVEIKLPGESEDAGGRSDPVEAIARASRVRTRRVKLRGDWWKSDCGSFLAFTGEQGRRPVAVLRAGRMRYQIFDPEDGTRRRVDARAARALHPEGVSLYRPLPEGALRMPDLVRFSFVRRKWDLAFALGTGLVATLLGMITPQATALLMDQAIPDADRRLVIEIGSGLLAAALGISAFYLAQGIVLLRIGIGTESDSQAALWDRLLRLRSTFFRKFTTGDLQSRIMAVNDIAQDVSGATLGALFASFMALLNLALLYYYSPQLSVLALALGAVVMLTTILVGLLLRRDIRDLMDLDGKIFGLVVQLVGGVGKLRVAGASARAFTHWLSHYSQQLRLWARVSKRREGLYLFNSILPILSSAALFAVSYGLLLEGREAGIAGGLTLGSFLAFNVAYNTFLGGVTSLSNTFVEALDLLAKGQRIKPILDEVPEVDPTKADPGRLTGRVAVEDVDFRYREDGAKILDAVSLRAEPGEFIAIVGPSGSGKSTLFRLLLGFETPASGSVTFDGQDLGYLDVVAVRRQLGVVLQSGRLDSGSIFENLSGGGVLTLEEAWEAAEAAGLADEIRQMPMGMHTVLSVGGSNLSGGQRQRLLIARALAHRPRILMFDEATSALDNRTQQVVSESLERLHVTRIVIAHRLSTIRNADRIYVLENGRLVQEGRYADLMAVSDGLFARMMARQLA